MTYPFGHIFGDRQCLIMTQIWSTNDPNIIVLVLSICSLMAMHIYEVEDAKGETKSDMLNACTQHTRKR